ncbi:MAG: hypothetical protein WAT39_16225 [Planctomycetota bacterium]
MGGQACVFYGAAEFSRDTDLAILASAENLARLGEALGELQAAPIAVPPLTIEYLERGHGVHFRCQAEGVAGMRVDVMSVLRGLPAFPTLWDRRTTVTAAGGVYELMALPDLVLAKKTQRDKDWPMIRRLVEASWFEHRAAPTAAQVAFWLRELRTPNLLIDVARANAATTAAMIAQRPLLAHAVAGREDSLAEAILAEERAERALDRDYWRPLRAELEQLRRARHPDS